MELTTPWPFELHDMKLRYIVFVLIDLFILSWYVVLDLHVSWLTFMCPGWPSCVLFDLCVSWLTFMCPGWPSCVLVDLCASWLTFMCSGWPSCVLVDLCASWLTFMCPGWPSCVLVDLCVIWMTVVEINHSWPMSAMVHVLCAMVQVCVPWFTFCVPYEYIYFINIYRPVSSISKGGGSYSGGKWTLSLRRGGGVSFGEKVDLCTIPYGAFGPRGVFGPPRPPPPRLRVWI